MSGKPSFNDIRHALDVLSKLTPESRIALVKAIGSNGMPTGEKLNEIISKAALC
jgi:hypothetical protein